MASLQLSEEERKTQTLAPEKLSLATQLVKMDGFVVFENVLSREEVTTLHSEFMAEFEAHVARTDPNRGANRYQMHLPFRAPFSVPAIIASPFALPIVEALLGTDIVCHYFASDTPLPGSDYQRVHSDITLLFPETPISLPAYSIVVNIPLVDFTEENGPLEIWPGGTQYMPGGIDMQTLAEQMTRLRVTMPAGSVLIRDMRAWHRGTPNRADHARPNMALIYSRPWLKTHYPPIRIPQATYDSLPERVQKLFRFEAIGAEL